MLQNNRLPAFLRNEPNAYAEIHGSDSYPTIRGIVRFYQTSVGVLVSTDVTGLPAPRGRCESPVWGFHIHDGTSCSGNETDPFADAMIHYNPGECAHPYHAGDLPPLFGAHGNALSVVLTDRFRVREIIGKTVIIHSSPDDFTTQPSGNSGTKIACGEIIGARRFR